MGAQVGSDVDGSAPGVFAAATATFAAFLLMIASLFDILQGLSAVADDELFTPGKQYLYEIDLTVWGWVHLGIGAAGVVVAVGILRRTTWAQVAGLGAATIGILTNFVFLPVYPVWSAFIIGFDVLVVWALCVQLQLPSYPDRRPRPVAALRTHQER
ncbi:DUF7144 family membrane protein [Nocardioides conyzicola]|uniref:DUF7144 domain-containing protein n=1 Tax=Nocardioides conyzicola TaxID=1651781 RepID=A0ABP8WJZ6_9ACTN